MKQGIKRWFVCCCMGLVLFAHLGMAVQAAPKEEKQEIVRYYGMITKEGDNFLHMQGRNRGEERELLLEISENTLVLDAVEGFPVKWEDIREHEVAYAYVWPGAEEENPALVQTEVVFCNLPMDFGAPAYLTVSELTLNEDGTSGTILAADGMEYVVPADCQILPYLTRNIVRLSDLTKGRKCIVWSQRGTAYKIVAFAPQMEEAADNASGNVTAGVWSTEQSESVGEALQEKLKNLCRMLTAFFTEIR